VFIHKPSGKERMPIEQEWLTVQAMAMAMVTDDGDCAGDGDSGDAGDG